jgi:hypothetical protein
MDLVELTTDLGEVHKLKSESEKELKQLREDFFDEATKACKAKPLARKTTTLELAGLSEEEARHLVARKNPGWTVVEVSEADDGWRAILEEDPAFADFVFVNSEDEQVYRRQRVDGTIVLDDEMCKNSDPGLWYEITTWQGYDELAELVYHLGVDHTEVDDRIDEWAAQYGWPEVVKPIEEWTEDQIKRAEPYLYQKSPTLKLAAPRKAKPEELDEAG